MAVFNVVGDSFEHELVIHAILRYGGYFFSDGVDVVLTELPPLPALCDSLVYTTKQTMDSFLVVIQHLHLLPCDLFFQVFKGHLDLECIGIQHIIQHSFAVDQPLYLQVTLGNSPIQPFLLVEQNVLDLVVGLANWQDLVAGVFACQIVINREASIHTIHAHHAATVLPVRHPCVVPEGTHYFIGQGYGYLRDVATGNAFNIELVKQLFMLFLLPKEGFDAGWAYAMSAVESECGEQELVACGAFVLAASHQNISENSMEPFIMHRRPSILMYMLLLFIVYSSSHIILPIFKKINYPQAHIKPDKTKTRRNYAHIKQTVFYRSNLGVQKAGCCLLKNSQTGNRTPIHGFKVRCPHR